MSDIPEWAKKRAVELANESRTARFGSWRVEDVEHDATMSAFARYIAEHEEPPVDPLDELVELLAPVLTHSHGMAAADREQRFREAIRNLVAKGNSRA